MNALLRAEAAAATAATSRRMQRVMAPNQVLGRTRAIGCTAVEITQRCNLDCTLCYLSEHSEQVRDLPLDEMLRRIDEVRRLFGPGTPVQITGGDPTLRKTYELLAIVRHAHDIGLYPALFTNGIAASRRLLARLADAGLADVAFHVDTTQRRPGGRTEAALNPLRRDYLERARGLGLTVIFNTTVHQGNVGEIPMLVRFFADHADLVGLVSFQLQAATGRGEWGRRADTVSLDAVCSLIDSAAGAKLPWDLVRVGHPQCHKYVPTLVINGRIRPIIDDVDLFVDFLRDFADVWESRQSRRRDLICAYGGAALQKPRWFLRAAAFALRHAWRAKGDLIAARGRVRKLSFVVHNFMDADHLDQERIEACSFMVMSEEGPISMCAYNARRDEHILQPLVLTRQDGSRVTFRPLIEDEARRRHTAAVQG